MILIFIFMHIKAGQLIVTKTRENENNILI